MDPSIFSLLCLITGFLLCHFLPTNRAILKHFDINSSKATDNSRFIFFQRLMGVAFLGIVPLLLIVLSDTDPNSMGLNSNKPFFILLSGFAIGSILILINFLNRKNPENLSMYPQIRKSKWNISLLISSMFSWLAYLLAYEFLFRGYLLFSMNEAFGNWNAITINVVLYSLVHVPKGWKEAVGSLPLGFLFCIVCLHAGNFLPAFLAHSCLALSNEWFALAANPTITLITKRR